MRSPSVIVPVASGTWSPLKLDPESSASGTSSPKRQLSDQPAAEVPFALISTVSNRIRQRLLSPSCNLVWMVTALCWAAYCAESIAASLLGTLLPGLAVHSDVMVTRLAVLVPAFNAGGALGSVLGGYAFDCTEDVDPKQIGEDDRIVVRRKPVLLLAALLIGIAICNLPMGVARGIEILLVTCFLHGVFNGAFRTGANWLMMRLHPPSQVAPVILAMHSCSGFGRFMAGVLGAYFAETVHFHWAFRSAMGLALILASLLTAAGFCDKHQKRSGSPLATPLLTSQRRHSSKTSNTFRRSYSKQVEEKASCFVGFLTSFAFLIVGVQSSFQYFITAYAVEASPPLNFESSTQAALLSALYGGAFACGRLLSIPMSTRYSALALLRSSVALTCLSFSAIVAFPSSSSILRAATLTLGLSLSSVFPGTINYSKVSLGKSMTGNKLSLLMLSATAGGVVLPQLAGNFLHGENSKAEMQTSGPETMMHLMLGACVASGVFLLVASSCLPRWVPGAASKV